MLRVCARSRSPDPVWFGMLRRARTLSCCMSSAQIEQIASSSVCMKRAQLSHGGVPIMWLTVAPHSKYNMLDRKISVNCIVSPITPSYCHLRSIFGLTMYLWSCSDLISRPYFLHLSEQTYLCSASDSSAHPGHKDHGPDTTDVVHPGLVNGSE